MSLTIYGASDDLVEIEGDINEEFYFPSGDDTAYLALSNGAVLEVRYTNDGFWRFALLVPPIPGSGIVEIVQGTNVDTDYTDKVTVTTPWTVQWALMGTDLADFARAKSD